MFIFYIFPSAGKGDFWKNWGNMESLQGVNRESGMFLSEYMVMHKTRGHLHPAEVSHLAPYSQHPDVEIKCLL